MAVPPTLYKEWLGIPDPEETPDHYTLLRLVQFEDDPEKIRKNYKKLNSHIRQYASGKYSTESQEMLNELAKAMLCLTDPERKREYDESLGREFPREAGDSGRQPMGKYLVQQGKLSKEQLKEAENFANARGLTMRDALVQMKLVDDELAAQALAMELGLPFVDLSDMYPDDEVLDRVPKQVVKRNTILPLFVDNDMLLVACIDHPEKELEDEIRLRFALPMRGVIATPKAINQGIAKYYAPGVRQEVEAETAAQPAKGGKKETGTKEKPKKETKAAPQVPMSQLSNEEQHDKTLKGYLFIIWSVMGCALLDWLLLPESLKIISFLPFLLTFIVPPLVALWVFKSYLK